MRDLKNKLTSSKSTKNTQTRKGKSFGYQVLGFGAGGGPTPFIEAVGGTITTSGDYKLHIFTGPGTFNVTGLPAEPADKIVDYFVVAGGGGSGSAGGGGAGGGGFRVSNSLGCISASPLANPAGIAVTAQAYPITVGAGGAADAYPGENSVFSSITSTGGGPGGSWNSPPSPKPGGSGGGGSSFNTGTLAGGTGNTPPTTPPQGRDGGPSSSTNAGGGGGGASAAGSPTTGSLASGGDGSYAVNDFFGPTYASYGQTGPAGRYFSGGGGGGIRYPCVGPSSGSAGLGGGGYAVGCAVAVPGTVNTGGGSGGGSWSSPFGGRAGGNGGSGIVVIKYKYQ